MSIKTKFSVFALIARHSLYKVLLILLVMFVAEIGILFINLQNAEAHLYQFESLTDKLRFVFSFSFIAITTLCALPLDESKSKIAYTLMRLSVPDKHVMLLRILYNICIFLLLFVIQFLCIFALHLIYTSFVPAEYYGSISLYLAFQRSYFFSTFLPFGNPILFAANFFVILLMSLAITHSNRAKEKWFLPVFVSACVLLIYFLPIQGALGMFGGIIGVSLRYTFDLRKELKTREV